MAGIGLVVLCVGGYFFFCSKTKNSIVSSTENIEFALSKLKENIEVNDVKINKTMEEFYNIQMDIKKLTMEKSVSSKNYKLLLSGTGGFILGLLLKKKI